MVFSPKEVLFSPTARCNLNCHHCSTKNNQIALSTKIALRFLDKCKKIGIKRVGFTGGEPFLKPDFLYALTRSAVKKGMLFDRIITNGVWYKDTKSLQKVLRGLYAAGYDGDICVSVDVFHRQDLKRIAAFIRTVLSTWKRPDIISIASAVDGKHDGKTKDKLKKLSRLLKGRLIIFGTKRPYIKGTSLFIKVFKIELSPTGKAEKIKSAWGGKWFKEDRCKGPGNIFFVEPSGDVKPCCGYAADSKELTIGNIARDSAAGILNNARGNRFVSTVFKSGLSRIRKRLEKRGIKFPGKTDNHCYFCNYVIEKIPKRILRQCLDR